MSDRFKEINNAEVGKRIRDLREKRDITREKLGERLELSDKTMRNIESGIYGTKLSNLYHIAQYFDVGIDYLIDGYGHSSKAVVEESRGYKRRQNVNAIEGKDACSAQKRRLSEAKLMELTERLDDEQLMNLIDAVNSMIRMTNKSSE